MAASERALSAVRHDRGDRTPREATLGPPGSLTALVQDRLVQQVRVLQQNEAAVRTGSAEGVHRMRLAARRLRSALITIRPLCEEPPDQLRDELRWLGRVLSPARDSHVLRKRLETALRAEPGELVPDATLSRLRQEFDRDQRQALTDAEEALASTRYVRLLAALNALAEDPPALSAAKTPAGSVLGDLVRRDAKLLRRAAEAAATSDAGERDRALHEVRKKAKRLRYAAELAEPAGGRRAKKLARRAKAVQQALGHHHDSVVAREVLRQLAARSSCHGEDTFILGVLYGEERLRARNAEHAFHKAWSRLPAPRQAAAWVAER